MRKIIVYEGPATDLLADLEDFDELDEFGEEFQKYFDFSVINDMLSDFKKVFSYDTLDKNAVEALRGADYQHAGNTWDFQYERKVWHNNDQSSIWVHMSSNGFRYPPLEHGTHFPQAFKYRHGDVSRGWMVLKEDFIRSRLPAVVEISQSIKQPVLFLYNKRHHRIDISFGKDHMAPFKICMEPGAPRAIVRDEYLAYFNLKRN